MQLDKNDCSTCPVGEERYEFFSSSLFNGERIQYDYRAPSGKLFSTIAANLERARQKRDVWLRAEGKS